MSVHHAKNIFSSSLLLNVVSLPSRPSNFVMRWKYWDLLDISLSRKRRRSFGHKFMLDNRCEIIPYIFEIGRNLIEGVKSLLTRWNVFYLDVRRHSFTVRETVCEDQRKYCNIHTHRNLGIPNRAIRSKFLPRHVGVTKHIRIGVTGPYPTTWHRKVELFFFFTVVLKDSTLKVSSSACRTRISEIEFDLTQSLRHVAQRPSCGTYMESKLYHTWTTKTSITATSLTDCEI